MSQRFWFEAMYSPVRYTTFLSYVWTWKRVCGWSAVVFNFFPFEKYTEGRKLFSYKLSTYNLRDDVRESIFYHQNIKESVGDFRRHNARCLYSSREPLVLIGDYYIEPVSVLVLGKGSIISIVTNSKKTACWKSCSCSCCLKLVPTHENFLQSLTILWRSVRNCE